jgi:hypothetical protein
MSVNACFRQLSVGASVYGWRYPRGVVHDGAEGNFTISCRHVCSGGFCDHIVLRLRSLDGSIATVTHTTTGT